MDAAKSINGNYKGKHILSVDQLAAKDLETIFSLTSRIKKLVAKGKKLHTLEGKIISLLFFEPSSRTFNSFSAAAKRLGADTLEQQNLSATSSMVKGESFEDTVRVFANYSDALVIRHPKIGAPHQAAQVVDPIAVINAGDGSGEHPTQAMLDLYTIYEEFGRIKGIKGLICADALYGRGVHSLLKAFGLFKNVTIYLLAPKELKLSKKQYNEYAKTGLKLIEISNTSDIPQDCDFWYWTRLQKERYDKKMQKKITMIRLTKKLIQEKANKKTIIMHILPRIDEVDLDIEPDPRVIFLTKQVRNGMFVRMALLTLVFGKKI